MITLKRLIKKKTTKEKKRTDGANKKQIARW